MCMFVDDQLQSIDDEMADKRNGPFDATRITEANYERPGCFFWTRMLIRFRNHGPSTAIQSVYSCWSKIGMLDLQLTDHEVSDPSIDTPKSLVCVITHVDDDTVSQPLGTHHLEDEPDAMAQELQDWIAPCVDNHYIHHGTDLDKTYRDGKKIQITRVGSVLIIKKSGT